MAEVQMKGWKTKLGAALDGFAVALGGTALTFPIEEARPWVLWVAALIGAVGLFFTIWGLGHKMEKAQNAVVAAQPVKVIKKPYYVTPVPPEELELLRMQRDQGKKDVIINGTGNAPNTQRSG